MRIRFIISVLLLAFSASTVASQTSADTETRLRSLVDRLAAAQLAYDAPAMDGLLTADYIEISPAGEFDPRAKVLGFYTPEAKAKNGGAAVTIDRSFPSVRVYGDTAVVISKFTYKINANGKELPPRDMMVTLVCRREKGSWKVASAQYTGVRPAVKPQ